MGHALCVLGWPLAVVWPVEKGEVGEVALDPFPDLPLPLTCKKGEVGRSGSKSPLRAHAHARTRDAGRGTPPHLPTSPWRAPKHPEGQR